MSNKVCIVCLKTRAKRCKQCKGEYYCSKECQAKDWKHHKQICKKVLEANQRIQADLQNRRHETNLMYIALFMLANKNDSEIPAYHLEYKETFPTEDQRYELLEHYRLLQLDQDVPEGKIDERDIVKRWRSLGLHPSITNDHKPGEIITGHPVSDTLQRSSQPRTKPESV